MLDVRSLLLLAPVAALLQSAPADACTCASRVIVSPSDGSQNVPLNAVIRVLAAIDSRAIALEWGDLRVSAGIDIHGRSGDLQYFQIRPTQPLKPNETYRVVVGDLVSTFRTAEDRDETPPSSAPVRSDTWEKIGEGFQQNSGCGGRASRTFELAEASDDRTPASEIWFQVYAADSKDTLDLTVPSTAFARTIGYLGYSSCERTMDADFAQHAWVGFKAVDWAGNESLAETAPPPSGCSCASLESLAPLLSAVGLGAFRRRRSS